MIRNRIYGALYGGCIGDALGVRYEFLNKIDVNRIIDIDITNNNGDLTILGGGPFNLEPGQVSDDSELMLCLLHMFSVNKKYNQTMVIAEYHKWFSSSPPDIGKTIKRALQNQNVLETSKQYNQHSLSNGVLMRICPVAIYGVNISDKELYNTVCLESDITHPNDFVKECVYVYCLAIKYIIKGNSLDFVKNLLLSSIKDTRLLNILNDSFKFAEPCRIMENKEELLEYAESRKYMGYIGMALQSAFYELFNGTSFRTSLINIIKRGGDTDTNGCIAGYLLGAYYGYKNLDKDWLRTIKKAKYDRKDEYPYSVNRIRPYIKRAGFIKY